MCGIFGYIGARIDRKKIPDVIEILDHRGPDAHGDYFESNVYLAHTRLSVQDLSENGNQPMLSADKNYVIIFNGEIYNHWEIRNELEREFKFQSTSDTETILYAYIKYGTAFLKKLKGIFALAILDKVKNEVVIARDPFGVKPLYFYQDSNKLLFSSELKSFLQFDIEKRVSLTALANYLTFLWSPDSLTPFENVKKIEPGHFVKVPVTDFQNYETKKFYQIPFEGNYLSRSESDLIDELELKLLESVTRQMLSDVPIGFFLSGGLDSSLLVALAKKINPNNSFDCFTIDTGLMDGVEGFQNDLDYAKKIGNYLDVKLNIVKADINILRDFDKMIWHLDEPQADVAPLNVLNICNEAKRKGIKVLIGGTGGDDIFSGYRRHQSLKYQGYIDKVPGIFRLITKSLIELLPTKNPSVRRVRKLLANIEKPKIHRLSEYFSWIPYGTMMSLFKDNFQKQLNGFHPTNFLESLNEEIPQEKSVLNQMLYWEIKSFLVDHNLNYTDKMAMACGVEVRVPFLDLELVDFSTKIPPNLKLKGKETKYILKKVAERYLPKEVIYRPKTGFGAPVRKWILNDLDPMIRERLSKERLKELKFFNPEGVWKLINDNKSGRIDASYSIWALLAIESWIRQFVEKSKF